MTRHRDTWHYNQRWRHNLWALWVLALSGEEKSSPTSEIWWGTSPQRSPLLLYLRPRCMNRAGAWYGSSRRQTLRWTSHSFSVTPSMTWLHRLEEVVHPGQSQCIAFVYLYLLFIYNTPITSQLGHSTLVVIALIPWPLGSVHIFIQPVFEGLVDPLHLCVFNTRRSTDVTFIPITSDTYSISG